MCCAPPDWFWADYYFVPPFLYGCWVRRRRWFAWPMQTWRRSPHRWYGCHLISVGRFFLRYLRLQYFCFSTTPSSVCDSCCLFFLPGSCAPGATMGSSYSRNASWWRSGPIVKSWASVVKSWASAGDGPAVLKEIEVRPLTVRAGVILLSGPVTRSGHKTQVRCRPLVYYAKNGEKLTPSPHTIPSHHPGRFLVFFNITGGCFFNMRTAGKKNPTSGFSGRFPV